MTKRNFDELSKRLQRHPLFACMDGLITDLEKACKSAAIDITTRFVEGKPEKT